MRVTANMSADNALYNIQKGRNKLDKLTESIGTGQNVNRPSDDPIASRTLLEISDKIKALDQYSSNVDKATTLLTVTSTALDGMTSIVNLAKKAAGTINSGSSDPNLRQSVNDQLVALKKQLVDLANTQYGDQYIFAGANNDTPPFNYVNNSNNGDDTQLTVEIGQNSTQALNATGGRVLLGSGSNPSYGSTDILAAFDNLIQAVGDKTTASDVAGISSATLEIEAGAKQLNVATSDILSRTTRLKSVGTLNDNTKNTLLSIASGIQDVDYSALGVEQTQLQTAYDAVLSTTAKLTQLSLLDYM